MQTVLPEPYSVYRNMEEWIEVTYNYNSLVIELDKYSL